MKKLFFYLLIAGAALFISPVISNAQTGTGDGNGYTAALDTLTDADTATHEVTVVGAKHCVSFSINITKISGTVGGSINIYGSIDGTNYLTTVLSSAVTITDASQVRSFTFSNNLYKKYKIVVITSGTQSCSHRVYYLYRKAV